eukprot:Tamp_04486.p1 GENE.Tamp_04486~~Tamp_04486.p1  ORF type:complete len:739 (+),score=157.37 Tamp_04486:20-2236(+)
MRPELTTALDFLKQVKEEMPKEYETFLEVLTQFRSQSVNAEMVVTVVAEMLVGRTHLLEGFSNFLPPACRDILLERYTEGKDGYAPRSSDHSMQSADDGCAGGMEGGDREPAAECEGSPTKPPSESTKFASKGKTRSPKGTRIDHTHPLVADMPVEVKRKRDSTSEMLLRPPKALLNSYAGMGKRMSQQQIWQAQLKKAIEPPNLAQVWEELERRLEGRIAEMQEQGDDWIPSVHVQDILNGCVHPRVVERLKLTGVIKIRGTVDQEEAGRLNAQMQQELRYCLGVDPSNLASYDHIYDPSDPKAFTLGGVQEMYYTAAQFKAREHPSLLKVRVWLNKVWDYRDATTQEPLYLPDAELCYVDRWRHRVPGFAAQTGMKEHIDNGAMSRWADAAWQSVYAAILHVVSLPRCPFCCLSSSCLSSSCLSSSCLSSSGLSVSCRFIWPLFFWSLRLAKRALSLCLAHPDGCEEQQGKVDEYDAWKVGQRVSTKGSSTAFRSFQGWLALSPQGAGDGTLEVIPLVAEAMAYVLLRPLCHDVPVHQFCGVNDTGGGDTLEITSRWHSLLLRAKTSIGHVDAGDTVWWHPDVIHGVEPLHSGKEASNVLYIPSTPMCQQNAKYIAQQRKAFVKGDAPPGFPNLQLEKSANRHTLPEKLSLAGRRAMGLEPYPESVIFCDLLDGAQATGASGQGAGADGNVGKEGEDTGVSKHPGFSEAEVQARRRLFEQCQALIFDDSEPVPAPA